MVGRQGTVRSAECFPDSHLPCGHRCTVCGTKIPPGPVYRVVDGGLVGNIELALYTGKRYFNLAPATEGPGHRSCMIYSAVIRPHLTSPGARRKIETRVGPETLPKGDPRGSTGAVVGLRELLLPANCPWAGDLLWSACRTPRIQRGHRAHRRTDRRDRPGVRRRSAKSVIPSR